MTANDETPLTATTLCNCADCGAMVEGPHVCAAESEPPPSQLHKVVLYGLRRYVVEALAKRRRR